MSRRRRPTKKPAVRRMATTPTPMADGRLSPSVHDGCSSRRVNTTGSGAGVRAFRWREPRVVAGGVVRVDVRGGVWVVISSVVRVDVRGGVWVVISSVVRGVILDVVWDVVWGVVTGMNPGSSRDSEDAVVESDVDGSMDGGENSVTSSGVVLTPTSAMATVLVFNVTSSVVVTVGAMVSLSVTVAIDASDVTASSVVMPVVTDNHVDIVSVEFGLRTVNGTKTNVD